MKALTTNGLTKLIQLIKDTFIKNTDVIETNTLAIDTVPTESSSNLITSGGVVDYTLNKKQISNCILEDPQNIKLELSDGTLTLKAGSVVCVPNGFEEDGTTPKFDEVTIESDMTCSGTLSANKYTLFIKNGVSDLTITTLANNTSGSGATTTSGLAYDISTNKISHYNSSGTVLADDCSFPIAIIASDGTQISSIDQTFQSIGYIGSTVFARKGLKVLIPNGRNDDGSLNNIEYTNESVLCITNTTSQANLIHGVLINDGRILNSYRYYYDIANNYIKRSDTEEIYKGAFIYECTTTDGVISNFQPYSAIKLLSTTDICYNPSTQTLIIS